MRRHFFESRAPKAINLGWDHGRYADYWSVLHFLSGILFATIGLLTGFTVVETFFACLVIALLYEGFEASLGVSEDIQNVLGDIALVSIGAPIVFFVFPALGLGDNALIAIMCILTLLGVFLFSRGWTGYLKNKLKEK